MIAHLRTGFATWLRAMVVGAVLLWSVFAGRAEAVEPKVATGWDFTAYLAPDGTVWTWGDNSLGQLGQGDTNPRLTPTQVPGLTNVISIATGFYHVLALKADGTVWAWGYNGFGQIGTGATSGAETVPLLIGMPGGAQIQSVACGGYHSFALGGSNGTVYAWGYNSDGQLGKGNTTVQYSPIAISGNFRSVSGGYRHSLGIGTDGRPYAWGDDSQGQLGDDVTLADKASPTLVSGGFTDVVSMSAGLNHSLMALSTGLTYAWGDDALGQLGNGSSVTADQPTPYYVGYYAWKVVAGYNHSLFLYPGGYVYAFGDNSQGQCQNNPSTTKFESPVGLGWLYPRPNEVVGGLSNHIMMTQSNGALMGWGDNSTGQLGLGSTSDYQTAAVYPSALWSLDVFIALSAGNAHTLALKADGTVWAWGSDGYGQLGDDATLANKTAPVQVSGMSGVMEIAAGGYHSLALTTGGQVYAWGWDGYGQLGNDTNLADSATPVSVPVSGIRGIGAGAYHSLAIYSFGGTSQVRSWGYNGSGQLGDATNTQQPTPVSVSGLTGVWKVEAGYQHSVALMLNGSLSSWGADYSGQLGNNATLANSNVPVSVGIISEIDVAAGQSHSTSVWSGGYGYSSGADYSGQLGNGAPLTNQATPMQNTAPSNIKKVSAGADYADFSVYLARNGTVYSCGSDGYGQLGDDVTNADQPGMVQVAGLSQICAITAGDYHAHALAANGTVYSWGYNGVGQLGNGSSGTNAPTPIVISTETWRPTVSVAVVDSAAGEAGPNTGAIRFTRSFTSAGAVTVNYSLGGSAVNGTDYTTLSGVAVIPANSSFVDVILTPIDDSDDEDNESADVSLSTGTQYRVGSPSTGSVTVSDNDTSGFVISAISSNTQESDAGASHTFTVRLATRPSGNVVLDFASSNTSEGLVDTNSAAGYQGATTLTFTSADWNTNKVVEVFGQNDDFDDGDIAYFISIVVNQASTLDSRYDPLDPPDVSISNIDNDTAAVVVSAAAGSVTEAGGTTTFTITLASRPYNPVNFTLSSSDTTEGVLGSGSNAVTIDPANWNTGATITIQGVNDDVDDGDQAFKIDINKSTSSDPAYNNLGGWDVSVTCVDDDTKGVTIDTDTVTSGNQSTPIALSEGGSAGQFSVRLNSQPTAQVTLTINTPASTQLTVDTDQGTAGNQSTLTFTTANWNITQIVRVTAVDDATIESSPHVGTILSVVNGGSGDYSAGVIIANVTCNITDNDTPGFTVSPTTSVSNRQITTESGGTASFTVRLRTQPAVGQSVSLRLNTNDLSEGRIAGQPIVVATTGADGALEHFTFDNNLDLAGMGLVVGQSITVLDATNNGGIATTITAIQTTAPKYIAVAADIATSVPERIAFIPAGSFPFVVTTNTAQSAGSQFNLPDSVDVSLIPLGSTVLVTSSGTNNAGKHGLVTSRSNSAGSKNIVVNLVGSSMSNAVSEKLLLAPPTTLTFTNATWNIDQTVTVTGQDDLDDETLTPTTSTYGIDFVVDTSSGTRDTNYDSVTQSNQFMRNQDDDVAGVRIVQEGGATNVDEANLATTDTYRVRLNTAPAGGKVVVIQISPDSQLSVSKSLLVFTAGNYSAEQVVTVTAVDDDIQESSIHTGTITHTIDTTLTDDVTYGAITGLDEVTASIADNDSAGIVVSPTIGLVTTEAGFASTFTVVLSSQPTASVTIGITSSNTAEGTVSQSSITFTPANWYLAQNVTMTGVNDDVDDGDTPYFAVTAAATSTDPNYSGLDPADVLVVNTDNDSAGVTVTQSGGSTTVTEGGATDSFTVVLTSQPASGTVVVTLSPGSQMSLSSSTLTFTTGNWASAQTVTVTAVNDNVAEGAHSASLGFAASGVGYSGLSIPSINVAITDNDTAGTTVSAAAVTTTEAGGTGAFTFRLNTQPTANVTVVLASNDTTEGTVSPSSLTFTPGNFSTNQTITVTGVNDDIDDGNIAYGITFTLVSADPAYNNLAVTTKSVTNTDNDTAGFTVSTISNALREDGTSGRFTVRLTSEPTAAVTIGVAVSDATEASVSAASLTFDASNWNEAQEITVSGVDDSLNDGDIASTVVLSMSSTTDPVYLPLNPADVSITTQDDDQAGFAVSTPTVVVAETAGVPVTVAFTVQLLSQPTADVTIPVSSSDLTEATVDVSSLTFTSTTWNVPQTITVTPVDDFAVDGTVAFTVVLGAATSSDTTGYSGLNPTDVNGSTTDNDSASFTLSATTATTSEGATTSVIQIALTSQPSANVTLTVTGLDTTEGSLSATTLTFTPTGGTAWNVPQSLTITGVDDSLDDGDQNYTLTLTPTSSDSAYNGLSTQTIAITNTDNDAAAVTITESGGTTVVAETGTTDTYTIQLTTQPLTTATITVTPDSQVRVNGSATPIVLTFNPAQVSPAANGWNTVRTITVSAVVDTFDEANPHAANITHTVANYVDQTSTAVTASPVSVTVNDNDPPAVTVATPAPDVGRASSITITPAMVSATDDDTTAASLVFRVILAPGQGDLWLDYGQVGQDLLINGDTFTQAMVTANRISYHNSGTPNVSDGFAFRVSDAVGNDSNLTIFNINITGFIPPTITLNGAYSPSYTENDPPVAVDTAPSVSDPDSTTYTLLTISQSGAGVSTDDEVFFATTGTITASSGTILYSGTPIGTYTGGTGSTDLTVSFTVGAAGDAQLTDLFGALRYRNTSEDPVAGVRTIGLVLRDDTGTENVVVTKDITVLAINDPPTIANATVITPKNVAVTSSLTIFDVDNYPLDVAVITPPGKGTLSGVLDVLTPTTLADALASRAFTYTPSTGEEGIDSFTVEVTDPDGAQSTATITVLIIGGAAARPWVVSDAPVEAEAGDPLSYDIEVDFSDLPTPPTTSGEVSYSLVGTLPAGVTFGAFTPNGTNATLTLTVGSGATGVIEAGIVVTETASNTSGYQPLTIVIVPSGSLGN